MKHRVMEFSVSHPKRVFWLVGLLTLLALAMIPRIQIDTDPENMLPADNPARVMHEGIKHRFGLSDMMVVGVVNEDDLQGIYNPTTLSKLDTLTRAILGMEGVVASDLMSLSTSDNITQKGEGQISFHWMMDATPETQAQADLIKGYVSRLPMLQNTLVSGDGKVAGIYVPIESKDLSYNLYQQMLAVIDQLPAGNEQYHITGLPVAEDTFGVEMFKQMAISAPAAGVLIFAVMLFFFRSVPLVVAPMLVAMATVIITMGLMIGLGYPVHIMSSMIAIFLMPIAVVDSVHMLSEFSDHYRPGVDKKALARRVVNNLFQPMLFTSITSMVGFASLNTADIPPVQVFGSFVAFGIALAFVLSITLVPAYMASLSDDTLNKMAKRVHDSEEANTPLARFLRRIPGFTMKYSKALIAMVVVIFAISGWGINKIVINDNPTNWFEPEHPIRVADQVLNDHFAGTYEAYLTFTYTEGAVQNPSQQLADRAELILHGADDEVKQQWHALTAQHGDDIGTLAEAVLEQQFLANDMQLPYWDGLSRLLEKLSRSSKVFLNPSYLTYLSEVQTALIESGVVGKTTGLPDLLKTVNRELRSGKETDYQLPTTEEAAAQAILTYQSSHRPNDVWHMVTPDYQSAVLWLQLKSGDNQDMNKVLAFMNDWFEDNPLPRGMTVDWGGLTYINVVWQDAMVSGMLESLMTSFVVVALMMMVLFRSVVWGLIAMLPLSVTISFIYGLIGLMGKNYDMPVAVLSALTLGMSIDFAIHFIERTRVLVKEQGGWQKGLLQVFEEPGRAISRNAIVIALGFTPLLFAPLVPYQTVGIFLASIMAISCAITLLVLPACLNVLNSVLFTSDSNTGLNKLTATTEEEVDHA
ncbi:efflux RND transporter permease subunit [Litoribrevibacter albus]|nr:MMPL family transporter [Litoribrevibacter albus]